MGGIGVSCRGEIRQFQKAGVRREALTVKLQINLTYLGYWWPPLAKATPVYERQVGGSGRTSGGIPTGQLEVGQHVRRQVRTGGNETSYESR